MKIKLAGHIPNSLVNGKGIRYVLFFNGCDKSCPGCHNDSFKDFDNPDAQEMSIEEILKLILREKDMIDGVTLSGGDPICQPEGLIELCKELKKYNLNIWMYTGELFETLESKHKNVLEVVDVVIDGPYIEHLKVTDHEKIKFRGSSNQRLFYKEEDGKFILDFFNVFN